MDITSLQAPELAALTLERAADAGEDAAGGSAEMAVFKDALATQKAVMQQLFAAVGIGTQLDIQA